MLDAVRHFPEGFKVLRVALATLCSLCQAEQARTGVVPTLEGDRGRLTRFGEAAE